MTDPTCSCGRPTSGGYLCGKCTTTLEYAAVNIAAYFADLETVRTKSARYGASVATRGSVGKTQPLPIAGNFADAIGSGTQLLWDTNATLVAWCRVVMEDQPELAGPVCRACLHVSCAQIRRRRWPAITPAANAMQGAARDQRRQVRSMTAYLLRQIRYIVSSEWAPAMLDGLLDTETRLRRMVDRPADLAYLGTCSVEKTDGTICEAEVYAPEGARSAECRGCGFAHDVEYRREQLLDAAQDYLVTASQAAHSLAAYSAYGGTTSSLSNLIRKWAERGRVLARGHDAETGRPLYRLGDIQDLLFDTLARSENRGVS